MRRTISTLMLLCVLMPSAASAGLRNPPHWDAVYLSDPNAWMVRKYQAGTWYLWGYSYGEQQTEDILDSLNFTNGCQGGCQPATTGCYAVVVADHETWHVTKNGAWIFETNFEADAYTTRDSLAITHPC